MSILDLLVASGLVKSKGEARRAIAEGGIYLNNQRVSEAGQSVSTCQLVDGHYLILRRGRKNYHLVKIS